MLENATLLSENKRDGWRLVVMHGEDDMRLDTHEIQVLKQRAMYLQAAINEALTHMPIKSWSKYCKDSANLLNSLGVGMYTGQTVERHHCEFRKNNRYPHPHGPCVNNKDKVNLPPVFEDNPHLWLAFKRQALKKLKTLNAHKMALYVHNVVIKSLMTGRQLVEESSDTLESKQSSPL